MPLRGRGALLFKLADEPEASRFELAQILPGEQASHCFTLSMKLLARSQYIRYFASCDLPLDVLKEDAAQKVFRQRRPLGVVAAITPWNLPQVILMLEFANTQGEVTEQLLFGAAVSRLGYVVTR
jgi:acyl-CoA reductase-like NAD-dependent aldehyde dehydrogenase